MTNYNDILSRANFFAVESLMANSRIPKTIDHKTVEQACSGYKTIAKTVQADDKSIQGLIHAEQRVPSFFTGEYSDAIRRVAQAIDDELIRTKAKGIVSAPPTTNHDFLASTNMVFPYCGLAFKSGFLAGNLFYFGIAFMVLS